MAVVTNAYTQATGTREDLIDRIYRVDVEDTPVTSRISRGTLKNRLFDWQIESLRAVNLANRHVTGDETSRNAANDPTRLQNAAQISKENATVSGTVESENRAGRAREMRRQKAIKTIELKKDVEAIMLSNQAFSNNEPRQTRGVETWIRTNTSRGTGGADPADPNTTPATTPTDGAQRAFTEDLLLDVLQDVYTAGGKPTMIVMSPYQKRLASKFVGRENTRQTINENRIHQATTAYASDFGTVQFVPHRYLRDSGRTVLCLDPRHIKLRFLRGYETKRLGRIGDAETEEIICEYGVEMCNERAHGLIADLNTSA